MLWSPAPGLPTLPRGARVEMNGAPGSPVQLQTVIGDSLAVPQGTRSRPQPREAACHHTTSAYILNTSDVVLPSSLWRFAQLSIQQRLSPVLPPGPSFGPLDRPAGA